MQNVKATNFNHSDERTTGRRELRLDVEVLEERIAPAYFGTAGLSPQNAFSGSTDGAPVLEYAISGSTDGQPVFE